MSSNLFIQKLYVENFKCFESLDVDFNTPNGTAGSGLNMLIGENGHGKTSLLEASNYLTCGRYTAENKISITIHHPENRLNSPYTDGEFTNSIEQMIGIIKQKASA